MHKKSHQGGQQARQNVPANQPSNPAPLDYLAGLAALSSLRSSDKTYAVLLPGLLSQALFKEEDVFYTMTLAIYGHGKTLAEVAKSLPDWQRVDLLETVLVCNAIHGDDSERAPKWPCFRFDVTGLVGCEKFSGPMLLPRIAWILWYHADAISATLSKGKHHSDQILTAQSLVVAEVVLSHLGHPGVPVPSQPGELSAIQKQYVDIYAAALSYAVSIGESHLESLHTKQPRQPMSLAALFGPKGREVAA